MTDLSCHCRRGQCPKPGLRLPNSQAGLGPQTFKVNELGDTERAGLMGGPTPGQAQGWSCLKARDDACLPGIQGRKGIMKSQPYSSSGKRV